jgi:homoserine kinase
MPQAVSVRVPATSANLGCAFDCAGIALQLYLQVSAAPRADGGLSIKYQGVTPERIPFNESNLIARTMRDLLLEWKHPEGLDLEIANQIPIGVGLGSSAAAIIAAIAASLRLAGRAASDDDVLSIAARLEGGHPDNVAAAWHGGFTLAVQTGERVRAWSCPVPDATGLVLVIPDYALPTEKARGVLPAQYTRTDSVHNLQRAAALAAQFFSGRMALAPFLFEDRFHQPYRSALIPGLSDVLRLEHPALQGVCLSGAGPSILGFVRGDTEGVGRLICTTLQKHGVRAKAQNLAVDNLGAKGWVAPEPSPVAP